MSTVVQSTNEILDINSITIKEVNRILEIGRLLLSVLTTEELNQLQQLLSGQISDTEIGNTGVCVT
jgi:hypothetical protein